MTRTIIERSERSLPADVFDTLELVAEAYGGIGKVMLFDYEERRAVRPCCAHGAVIWAAGGDLWLSETLRQTLNDAGVTTTANDDAVRAREERIPFSEWCRRLNVVRGE